MRTSFKNTLTISVFPSDRQGRGMMGRLLCLGQRSRRSLRGRSISWWGQVGNLSSRGHTLPGKLELHLCFALILSGVNDGTCRKWLWFRWHFLPVLTSWCAGAIQQCTALSLFHLTMLFLHLCVFVWQSKCEDMFVLKLYMKHQAVKKT